MNHCRVSEEIAELAAEPECKECPECVSAMTEDSGFGITWSQCDKCGFVVYIFKGDEDE